MVLLATLCFAADNPTTQPQNLLLNGEAEQGKDGQPSIWFEASVRADGLKMQQDTTQARSGKASLYIENSHKYDQPTANNWGQTLQEVPVGKTLTVSAAIKTAGAESANVCLQCWDASGEKMLAFGSTPVVRGDQDWATLKSQPITVPAETKSIIVRAALGGTGKVWFDDLVVSQSDRPATKPLGQEQSLQPSSDLNKLVDGNIVGRIPIARDQMVLCYLPDWSYGNVDNIAVANNQGGVRTLFAWDDFKPKSNQRFVLAVYSRKTTVGEKPSPIGAFEILQDFDEQTPWTKQPKTATDPVATFNFQPGMGWKGFDITPLLQKHLQAGTKSHGVQLRFLREDADVKEHSGYTCVSREGEGGWEDRRPVLLVVE
jgi:hypothetical protein